MTVLSIRGCPWAGYILLSGRGEQGSESEWPPKALKITKGQVSETKYNHLEQKAEMGWNMDEQIGY